MGWIVAPTLYDVTMRRLLSLCVLPVLLFALTACDGTTSTASSTAPPTSSATPTATAKPVPDTEQVDIVQVGVGAFMLQAIPVAILHNKATHHTATHVVTHFSVRGMALDGATVSLAPGETLAVAALCTDTCNGAGSATATVTVGSWSSAPRTALTATGGGYSCSGGCGGHENGDVTGTISGTVSSGAIVYVTAACFDGSGAIIGGGSSQTSWGGGASMPVDVSVLVSGGPARCQVFATVTT
jgi:hypothetical protein